MNDFVLIYVGRLDPEKGGVDCLLRAMAELCHGQQALRCVIVGEGECLPRLKALAAELDIADRVVFTGLRRDIASLLRTADVFVLPSLHEGTPLALLEAMAEGLPVVATKVGEVPFLLEHGHTGLLVEPGRVEDLIAGIDLLARRPDLRRRLGEAARDWVCTHNDVAVMCRRTLEVYEEVLGSSGGDGG